MLIIALVLLIRHQANGPAALFAVGDECYFGDRSSISWWAGDGVVDLYAAGYAYMTGDALSMLK